MRMSRTITLTLPSGRVASLSAERLRAMISGYYAARGLDAEGRQVAEPPPVAGVTMRTTLFGKFSWPHAISEPTMTTIPATNTRTTKRGNRMTPPCKNCYM